jgi:hypothetical protein
MRFNQLELCDRWNPMDENYFNMRNTVKISRELIELRGQKQQEVFISYGVPPAASLLHLQRSTNSRQDENVIYGEPFEKMIVKYFEYNYGKGKNVNLAHQKVVTFLEALLQYCDVPVINFIRNILVPKSEISRMTEVSIWLYVESKKLLQSWKAIEEGAAIHTNFDSTTMKNDVSALFLTLMR